MHTDEELRGRLIDLADRVRPSDAPATAVLSRARRYRRRRHLVVSSALLMVAVLTATTLTRLLGVGDGQLTASPPDGPFLGWKPAGNAVSSDLTSKIQQAWDGAAEASGTASRAPHTQVRTLLASRTDFLGLTVIAQAYDGAGEPRIAFFTGGHEGGTNLMLRADRLAPDPVNTKVVSLVSARVQGPVGSVSGDYWGAYAIVLAMPGVTSVQVSSTTIDDEMRQGDGDRSGPFRVQPLPISSTALTTTIKGFHGKARLFSTVADGGAIGDAEPVTARVITRDAQRLTVSVGDPARVRPGHLAATGSGLVGRVAAVDRTSNQVVIELITAAGFSSSAYTDISNHRGRVSADGTSLLMLDLPADAQVNPGNRVLVPDPAQQDSRAGALTIGRAASGTSSVSLTPTADLTEVRELSIMVPPSVR